MNVILDPIITYIHVSIITQHNFTKLTIFQKIHVLNKIFIKFYVL